MKRIIATMLIVILTFSVVMPVLANDDIKVKIDGRYIDFDVTPTEVDGRVFVPMRAIFEALGATVEWNEVTQNVTATKGQITVSLTINEKIGLGVIDGDRITVLIDPPARMINNKTFVPVRFIAEFFMTDVEWDDETKTVIISSKTEADYETAINDQVVFEKNKTKMYATDGRIIVVDKSEVEAYKKVGWFVSPIVTMYAPDGRTLQIADVEIEAYKKVGWFISPVITMYAPDGRTLQIADVEREMYKNVGWYDEPVTKMHAADGRELVVKRDELETYKKVGWHESARDAIASAYSRHNIKIFKADVNINSVGGAKPYIVWRNDSEKTIKYIHFTVVPYNSVGDIVSCDISGDTYSRIYSTGPYYPFNRGNIKTPAYFVYRGQSKYLISNEEDPWKWYVYYDANNKSYNKYYLNNNDYNHVFDNDNNWEPIWYNYSIKKIRITKVLVEYMDGSSETINNPPMWENIYLNAGV